MSRTETGTTWLWGRDMIRRARDKDYGKPVGCNTLLKVSRVSPTREWESDEVVYAIEFHSTEVVRYYPNGVVSAGFNGWPTITTKRRISDYSPFAISTDQDQVIAHCGRWSSGQKWIGGDYTWFFWKDGHLIFQDGSRMPDLRGARIKLKVPDRRDTVTKTLEGDAFKEGNRYWVAAQRKERYGDRLLRLYPYYGDHPENRALFITDNSESPRDLLSPLEMLANCDHGGLTPVNRFLWKNPVESA
jgi:hypothetical protein